MRILNSTTELQIRLRPDEVDGFIDLVLGATQSQFRRDLIDGIILSQFRRDLIDGMKRECLL